MSFDLDTKIYYTQLDIDYEVKSMANKTKSTTKLKLNIYFDPISRGFELTELDATWAIQKNELDMMIKNKTKITNESSLKKIIVILQFLMIKLLNKFYHI
jgi:hypothetical protein